ncbi:MAG: hypothetical protein JNM56_14040 [Planctomycetia bacterium]|nr:hypothetical protein [Planctomycetia bacterium]
MANAANFFNAPVPQKPDNSNPAFTDSTLSIEQVIDNALGGIQAGMAPTALDAHLRNFCQTLVNCNASGLVLNGCYNQVKARLKGL